jgi:hypothetical protein
MMGNVLSSPSKELHSEPRSDSFTHLFEGIAWGEKTRGGRWPVGLVMLDIRYLENHLTDGAFNGDSTNKNRDSTNED